MPLDVLKVRMQLQGRAGTERVYSSTLDATFKIFRAEGPSAFFKGIKPALLRQSTYGTMRVGLYPPAKRALGVPEDSRAAAPLRKIVAGVTTGAFASAVCNPTDLIKVRMQAEGMGASGPAGSRYRGIVHAARSVVREEGWRGLYKGVGPTTGRASIVAAAELGSYDEIKMLFLRNGANEGIKLHLATAALAGVCATAASSPFDVVKSRVMSQPVDSRGRGTMYNGMFDCFRKCIRTEGINFMWRGFFPNFLCKGPSVIIFFVLYEQFKLGLESLT